MLNYYYYYCRIQLSYNYYRLHKKTKQLAYTVTKARNQNQKIFNEKLANRNYNIQELSYRKQIARQLHKH